MRRSALFLLTLHLAAGSVLAQVPSSASSAQTTAPTGGLEIRIGEHGNTSPGNNPAQNNQQTAAPLSEKLFTFDPQRAEVVWYQNHWQLVADAHVLKDFGRREVEARLALRLVRELHLNQHGVVGVPEPVMEYWLSNGHAPHGVTTGLHLMPIDPAALRVEQTQGQWCVRDSGRVLFNFRTNEADAHEALAVLRKYGFTQIGTLGGMGPSMIVMLSHFDGGNDIGANVPHLVRQSPLRSPSSNDPNAKKPAASDMNAVVTPAIPPLRTDTHKQTVNEFGRPETVEVLPANSSPSHPAADGHIQQTNAFGHAETVEVLPANTSNGLKRIQPLPPLAWEWIDRTPFDWRQFQIRPEGGQFALAAGSMVLARFKSDHDARLAMAIMQHYHFTEQDSVGRPQPFCSYFLCNGQAPRGQYFGMHSEPFLPEKLSVALVDNHWAIVTPEKPLLLFGDKHEEASVMLDVIQRQQFDRLCHVGDEHGMMFFVRSH
jgi:hypothetical protein